jgi:hypothetical protein
VYEQEGPGQGIRGYDFKSPADHAFPFDYDHSRELDHIAYIDLASLPFGSSKTTMENSQLSIKESLGLESTISYQQQIPPSPSTMTIAERWTTSSFTVLALGASGFLSMMVMTSY